MKQHTMIVNLLGVIACSALVTSCSRAPKEPQIAFVKYDKAYESKPDLAQVEHQYPLSVKDLNSLTPENLATLDQEQLDQIYARLTAGPIPDGAFDGSIVFPKGMTGKARISEIVQGTAPGLVLSLKGSLTDKTASAVDKLGESLWKGKVFYRDERVLRNRIDKLDALKALGLVEGEPKRRIIFEGHESALLFPAKLYCGQSLLDSRRESIIIDYAFTDEIADYQEKPDFLAGRRGLKVRDEIRMVRPGFYLGRAYLDRVFILNFTLYNKEIAERDGSAFNKTGTVNEDCWMGTQAHHVAT